MIERARERSQQRARIFRVSLVIPFGTLSTPRSYVPTRVIYENNRCRGNIVRLLFFPAITEPFHRLQTL